MKSLVLLLMGLVVPALVAGCDTGHPDVVPVSGRVTWEGEPVAGAQVTFITPGAPRHGFGVTDAEGRFRLSTFGSEDGALIGTHTVTISQPEETPGGEGMSPDDPDAGYAEAMRQAAVQPQVQSRLPDQYADPETTPLTGIEVTRDGPNEFTFDLD